MKFVSAADYVDVAGNVFVFYFVGGQPHCYRRLATGNLKREPEWGRFPRQTVDTLLRIVGWLKLDGVPAQNPYADSRFRYTNPNSCSDCHELFA